MISVSDVKKAIVQANQCRELFNQGCTELVLNHEWDLGQRGIAAAAKKYSLIEGNILQGTLDRGYYAREEILPPKDHEEYNIYTTNGYVEHWCAGKLFKERNPEMPYQITWWETGALNRIYWENPYLDLTFYYSSKGGEWDGMLRTIGMNLGGSYLQFNPEFRHFSIDDNNHLFLKDQPFSYLWEGYDKASEDERKIFMRDYYPLVREGF